MTENDFTRQSSNTPINQFFSHVSEDEIMLKQELQPLNPRDVEKA